MKALSATAIALLVAAAPLAHAQSTRPGIGAIPYSGGTTFRVWAPFATAVHAGGTFNAWSSTANPLVSEGNGYWSNDIAGVADSAQYKFVITPPTGSVLWKND